jgi:hypothetical protein
MSALERFGETVRIFGEADAAAKDYLNSAGRSGGDRSGQWSGSSANAFDNKVHAILDRYPGLEPGVRAVCDFVEDGPESTIGFRAIIGSRALSVLVVCEQFGDISQFLTESGARKQD